jgi:hypothetical protein
MTLGKVPCPVRCKEILAESTKTDRAVVAKHPAFG